MPDHSTARPDLTLATDAWRASAAGLAATLPMSAVMLGLHQAFPSERARPLPPHVLTMQVARPTGWPETLGPVGRRALTTAGHFAYGAAAGSLYALWQRALPLPAALGGSLFGLAVWAGSYLGWVPAVGLMRPATRQPLERNLMMMGAHLVWGAVLGLAVERWQRARRRAAPPAPAETSRREIAPL